MKWPNGTKTLFKTISALMAGIFLWQQVAWAGDLIDTTLNKQYEEQSQTFAPAYIKSQQANNEAMVTQKQAVEDAANTQGIAVQSASASTQTTADDSITLQGPKGGSASKSSSAISAATMQSLTSQDNSSVLSVTTSAGDVIYYKDGAIDYIAKKDGTVLRNIVVDENNNLLVADITYTDGTVQNVNGGKTTKITKSDGTVYNYNSEELIESVVYPDSSVCSYSYVKDGQENIIEIILTDTEKVCHYDSDNKLTKVIFNDGKTIEYDNGIITKATDEDGTVYTYDTTESTQGGVTEYLAKLKTIVDSSGVKYDITDSNITGVELSDKTITDLGLDGSGNIVNGNIEYSDGTKVSVENKKITEITETSGITTDYQYSTDGLNCDVTIDDHGTIKNYTYSKDTTTGSFTIEDVNGEYEYDALWKLEKFTNDIGSFQHTYSAGGSYTDSILTSPDGTVREYDATQRLIKTIFLDSTTTYYVYSGESIQQAINTAKSGDTIYVHAGTYHEHIVLSSGVNLIGEDKSTVIINGSYQACSNVIVASGNNRIENITISGGGPYSGYPSSAIRVEGDNVSIRNNSIVDNQDYAVYIWSGNNILVEKNFFKNDNLGVQLPNSGTTIQYNTFVNNNIAINVLNGPAPIIRNNIITGSTFQSIYEFSWSAYAAGQPASGYAVVEGNILYNNAEHGGYYCKCLPPAVISQTSGNVISNPLYVNPSVGDYSIPVGSPAFGKGALLPQAISDSLDNASGLNITTTLATLNAVLHIPAYAFQTDASKIFPDGETDILNNAIPDISLSVELPDKNTPYFDTITYDENRTIKEILKADGETITYKDGLVDTILSSDSSTYYNYTLSGLNNVDSITVESDGIKQIYDQYGNLSTIDANGVSMAFDNGQVSQITKDDGTIIQNAVFDANNSIISATITNPSGTTAIYNDSVVREIDQPDGSKLYYDANGNITNSISSAGISYSYASDVESGISYMIATADNAATITDSNAIIYQKFDSSNTLIQAKKKDGTVINYTYTKDASGNIVNTYANDGKSITTYDANNNITTVEVLPTTDDPVPTISNYQYNQIRTVYKGDTLVYNYSYETDTNGNTITVIQDVSTGDVKRYEGGVLRSDTDVNNVVTSYEYNSGGKVSESIVTSLGQIINTYTYIYNGDNTIIEDADEIIRTYDKNNNLIQLEQNGQTYQYTYKNQTDGTQATIQDLVSVKDSTGTVTNYSQGNIQSIVELDGTVITDVVITDGNVSSYTVKKDGITYFIVNDMVTKEVKSDGTQEYDFSYANSIVFNYSSNQIKQNLVSDVANFSTNNLLINTLNNNLQINLSRANVINYGDGHDGALNVVAGQTVYIDSSKQYSSINIAAGAVVTVAPWNGTSGGDIEIQCNGPIVINGTIQASATGYRGGVGDTNTNMYYPGPIEGMQGESYTGSQAYSPTNNYGGGGGYYGVLYGRITAAAGGSYGTKGTEECCNPMQGLPASAGDTYGDQELTTLYRGSGGGGGDLGSAGGRGGGIIKLVAPEINISGSISADGGSGGKYFAGGGSGGSILLIGDNISISGNVSANGGQGGSFAGGSGGNGGNGRIRINYITFTGNIPMSAYMYQIPYQTQGQVVSPPIAVVATQFGNISANKNIPIGTNIVFMTRTGASANLSDGTWSDWVAATSDDSGYKVHSPVNNYMQYEALLTTTDTSKTPSIYSNGDYVIKLDYSYNQITSVAEHSILPDNTVIESQSSQSSVLSQITMSDGTVVKYFNDQAVSVTNPNGTAVSNFNPSAYSPDQVLGTKAYRQAQITLDISKDSKITTIIDSNPVSVYQQYPDGHMTLLTEYEYDGNGDLVLVKLPYARDSLEEQITQARDQIAQERDTYLANLTQQEGVNTTQIQTQFAAAYSQIESERAQLTPMLYQQVMEQRWVGWWIFGHWETYQATVEVPQVRDALNQLDEQERQLNIQEADAYAQLNSQIQSAENKLNTDEGTALTAIQNQQNTMQAQIINEETSPVVINYYREILGRDPSDAELAQWVSTVNYNSTIDVGVLKTALLNSDERTQDEAFIASIKGSISDTLNAYVNTDAAGKQSILSSLGLTLSDAITLNKKSDVDAILSLLDKQNIHFGRSAFVSLQTLLSANNINSNLNDLAQKTILIDIFTGASNPLTEGNLLELSMYSLTKTAALYGVNVYNTKLNYTDLTQAFASGGTLIAHLKNDHYVDVTNISSDGTVTYIEHNKGQNGTSYTVSEQAFENSWTGYAITKAKPADTTKILPDTQAQRIKGSCLFFLLPLIGMIVGAISSVVTAAIAAISVVVSSISAILAPIISGIGALFTGIGAFMADIGSAIFSVISFVGDSLLPTIGAFFTDVGSFVMSGLSAFGGAVGNALGFSNLSTLGITLGKTIVTTALSIGISKGLDAIGVNPIVSNLLSSFVTGGVSGLFNNFSAMGFIGGALQGLAIQTVNIVGQALGIPQNISSIIGIAAGSIIGVALNGVQAPTYDSAGNIIRDSAGNIVMHTLTGVDALSYSLKTTILPSVTGALAYTGVTELGNILGIDPRISYLAGIGIRSSINAGLSGEDPSQIWGSVQNGLLGGIASIGINYATQELDLDPLLANLGFSAIASVINASIQTAIGQGSGENTNFFQSIYNTYINNALTFLNYNGTSNAWQQAAYIAQVQDFSNIIMEKGLVVALNTYGAGFLNAVAVNQIVQSGLSIGDYFKNKLDLGQGTARTLQDSTQVTEISVPDSSGNVITNIFFVKQADGTWNVVGKEDLTSNGAYLSWGNLGVDTYGKLGYTDAQLYSIFDSDTQFQKIQDGQQSYAEIKDSQGNTILIIEPTADGRYNIYDSYGEYVDAKISDNMAGNEYNFSENSTLNQTLVLDNGMKVDVTSQSGNIISLKLDANDSNATLYSELASGIETGTGYNLSNLEKAFTTVTLLSKLVSGSPILDSYVSDLLIKGGLSIGNAIYDNIAQNKDAYENALINGMQVAGWGYDYFIAQSTNIVKQFIEDKWQDTLDIWDGVATREQSITDYAKSLDYTTTSDVKLENVIETSLSKVGTYDINNPSDEEASRKNEEQIIAALEIYIQRTGSSTAEYQKILNEALSYALPQRNQSFNNLYMYLGENVTNATNGDAGVQEGVDATMDLAISVIETHNGTPQVKKLEDNYQRLNHLVAIIREELGD